MEQTVAMVTLLETETLHQVEENGGINSLCRFERGNKFHLGD
jgi:hypothetical protein